MTQPHRVSAVILAAGEGKRMGSDRAKVLHEVGGRPMVCHVLATSRAAGVDQNVVVVGHQREAVAAAVAAADVEYVVQDQQLGTGHAVQVTVDTVVGDTVVVLCGDAPLVPVDLLDELLRVHRQDGNACTAVAARMADPAGYGRMITDDMGRLQAIVEHRDASEAERAVDLINSGIYAFDRGHLFAALQRLSPDNAQGEYYLTDVPKLLVGDGAAVGLVITEDPAAVLGVNTTTDLAAAERLYQDRQRA